jgi:hypothetical protein
LAAAPNYLPDYNYTQQIIGTTIYVAIVVITVVTFIVIRVDEADNAGCLSTDPYPPKG